MRFGKALVLREFGHRRLECFSMLFDLAFAKVKMGGKGVCGISGRGSDSFRI